MKESVFWAITNEIIDRKANAFFDKLGHDIAQRPREFGQAIDHIDQIFSFIASNEVDVGSDYVRLKDSFLSEFTWGCFYPYWSIGYAFDKITPFGKGKFRDLNKDSMSYQNYFLKGDSFLGRDWWFSRWTCSATGQKAQKACNYEPPKERQAKRVFFRVFFRDQPFYKGGWVFIKDFDSLEYAEAFVKLKNALGRDEEDKRFFIVEQIEWVIPRRKIRCRPGEHVLSFETGHVCNFYHGDPE